jgi:O-antigen ligase
MLATDQARNWRAILREDGSPRDEPGSPRNAIRLFALAGCALLGVIWGGVVAVAGLNALYLCFAFIGCGFILRDFRIGVVLLILLMPVSYSTVFPHGTLGVIGLNLLLVGTLGSCLLHGRFDGSIRRFVPHPMLWLYIVPLLVAGALGMRHVGDIAPGFFLYYSLGLDNQAVYLREFVVEPLSLVLFALLVGAAVSKSEKPEMFLIPALISIVAMGSMVIVFVVLSGVWLDQLSSSTSRDFLSALGLHANVLGRMYAAAYALLLFTWVETKETGPRLALLASMGLVCFALLLTFSRSAFFAFMVVNALFLFWRRNVKTLFVFAVAAAVALLVLPDAAYHRVLHDSGQGLNAISAGRVDGIWLPLLPEVLRSPVYGNGLGSILWSDAMHRTDGLATLLVPHAHNAYLESLLDMGFFGLILVCGYFVHVWKGFRVLSVDTSLSPRLRGFYMGAAAGLAGFLLSGVTDSSLMPKAEHVFLWLAIGMMYGARAKMPASDSALGP